jgi:hypothetical protein
MNTTHHNPDNKECAYNKLINGQQWGNVNDCTCPSPVRKEKPELVYAGLVYMGSHLEEYKKIVAEKYGTDAELRDFSHDEIHEHRAQLFTTPEIFKKDFGGSPKLIS